MDRDTEGQAYRRLHNPGGLGEFYTPVEADSENRRPPPRTGPPPPVHSKAVGQSPASWTGAYRRMVGAEGYPRGAGGAGGYQQPQRQPNPLFGSRRIKYGDILLFVIAALLGFIVIFLMVCVFEISSHKSTVVHLVSRVETMQNLARNINDASQVMRRVLGEQGLYGDEGDLSRGEVKHLGDEEDPDEKRHHKAGGWTNWLQDRGPDQEALITDNAARALVDGVRAAVGIMRQMEQTRLMEVVARATDHADQVIAGPQAAHILQALDTAVQHPQAQSVAEQTLEIVGQVEAAVLPVVDAVATELRQRLEDMMQAGQESLTGEQFRAMVHEVTDVVHKVGTGMRDLVTWYRTGGPSEAAELMADLVTTSKELLESPAAKSLVQVLEGIDWAETGDRLSDAAHNGAAILQTVNQAGTVDAGDRLIRALAGVLEDPGTKRVMALLPGIAANATALLAKPSVQSLVTQSSALMRRVDGVLSEAEAARTVERAAEFMGTLRLLLGALVDGGLHLELGEPGANGEYPVDQPYLDDRASTRAGHKTLTDTLRQGLPHIVGAEPEKTRAQRLRDTAGNGKTTRRRKAVQGSQHKRG